MLKATQGERMRGFRSVFIIPPFPLPPPPPKSDPMSLEHKGPNTYHNNLLTYIHTYTHKQENRPKRISHRGELVAYQFHRKNKW